LAVGVGSGGLSTDLMAADDGSVVASGKWELAHGSRTPSTTTDERCWPVEDPPIATKPTNYCAQP
jgi:hypothetical protein